MEWYYRVNGGIESSSELHAYKGMTSIREATGRTTGLGCGGEMQIYGGGSSQMLNSLKGPVA